MGQVEVVADAGGKGVPVGQGRFEGAEEQGQRGAELVADVGEELGLGPVDVGQRLLPAPLLLAAAGVGEAGSQAGRDLVEEAPVARVEGSAGAQAEDHHARRPLLGGQAQGEGEGARRGLGVGARSEAGKAVGQVVDDRGRAEAGDGVQRPHDVVVGQGHRPGRGRRPRREPGGRGELGPAAGAVEQVDEGEGHQAGVGLEDGDGPFGGLGDGGRHHRVRLQPMDDGRLAPPEHVVGGVDCGRHGAGQPALVAPQGGEGRREEDLSAVDGEGGVLHHPGPARLEHVEVGGAVGGPRVGPRLAQRTADHPGEVGAQQAAGGVVGENDQVGAPMDDDR